MAHRPKRHGLSSFSVVSVMGNRSRLGSAACQGLQKMAEAPADGGESLEAAVVVTIAREDWAGNDASAPASSALADIALRIVLGALVRACSL